MFYPTLRELNTSREMVDVFKGYNHNLRIGEGEFYDMKNLSSDSYPVLSPRAKRGVYASYLNAPQGLIAKDGLCHIDGQYIYINGYQVDMGLSALEPITKPKQLISMGSYIIIMPDKKYINTLPTEEKEVDGKIERTFEHGKIEATVTTTVGVSFTLCKADGSEYGDIPAEPTEPTDPKNMDLWIDTSSTPHQLKQYSEVTGLWEAIATTYIKIFSASEDIGIPFNVYDGITISGVVTDGAKDVLNGSFIIYDKGDNYIVVTGIIDKVSTQPEPITISRRMPEMDFIVESGNRLWGCRYGLDMNGNIVNEIYASKLGDFKNWNCFMGISTDSYVASVGTDGQFTGAITHLGYPLFFKENCVHKVYGNYPANYQIQTTACRGVQKGCDKSLAIVNEVLYYKSHSGVCAYDGSLPVEISSALGEVKYYAAVAGALGNKYYISMRTDESDNRGCNLFVYDTAKGMWHREDNTEVFDFCNCRGALYYIDYGTNSIMVIGGTTQSYEANPIEWEAVTGIIGTDSPDKKYISRVDIRMSLKMGSKVYFFIEYDSSGEWEYMFAVDGIKLASFPVPIKPQRCDHFRLKMVGVGEVKIFSICKNISQGSDV